MTETNKALLAFMERAKRLNLPEPEYRPPYEDPRDCTTVVAYTRSYTPILHTHQVSGFITGIE